MKKSLGKRYKEDVVRDLNTNKKFGIHYYILQNITGLEEKLFTFLKLNYEKYSKRSYVFNDKLISSLKSQLAEKSEFHVAEKDGDIVAILIGLKSGPFVYHILIGQNEEILKKSKTYFALCFYNQAKRIEKEELQQIIYGPAHYRLKRARGCTLSKSYDFIKPKSSVLRTLLKIWSIVQLRWYERKYSDLEFS